MLIAIMASSFSMLAQTTGDTIEVRSLNYNSTVRDTMIDFPVNPALTYEKIIMLYSMRCKDGLVSTGTDRNKGCGEWDYSCNTYITDSSRVDSSIYTTPEYTISGFSGSYYAYTNQATFNYFQQVQQAVTINSTIGDTARVLGTGTDALSNVLQTATHAGKSQYLFTQAELSAAGLTTGNIDALSLSVMNNPSLGKMFKVRLKATSKTVLDDTDPDLTGFTEVYNYNTNFTSGSNRIQFHTPFVWNGTSNIIVEFSFTNKTSSSSMTFTGDSLTTNMGMTTSGEVHFDFDGANYIEADTYRGIGGDTNRTIEVWIRTTVPGKEIVSWGTNAQGQKYLLRLDGSGRPRIEVNNGYAVGTSILNDGNWHHIAAVLNGSNTENVQFYIDGVAENKTALGKRAVNTGTAFKVRITRGVHNLYWDGEIEEVRIWSTNLAVADIQDWMFKPVSSSHTNYANLELYYPFNEGTGIVVNDASSHQRNATVYSGALWSQFYGLDHFKRWQLTAKRPNTTFYQGVYNLTVSNDTIIDSVMNQPNLVTKYQIVPKNGTLQDDSIAIVSQNNYWEAVPEKLYDPSGNQISTIPVTTVGTITVVNLNYYRRFPSKLEIMSFVTPYGINLNMGIDGKTWAFDVTDFAPVLTGSKRMTIERGGQWQEDMDIRFLYIVGTPPRDVLDIRQIWRVDSKSFAAISSGDAYEERDVMMDAAGSYFKLRSTISGHGQEGEFIPRIHNINLDGGPAEFSWQVWKECAYNPVYPQGGTWIYDRAGWCPGMATDTKEMDITDLVTPGQATAIDYTINTATGTSNYIVNNQLVTYGAANFTLDAAVIDLVTPSSKVEYERTGSICDGPVVRIQNTGSTILTSLTIKYWINNTATPVTYNWTGYLGFMEWEDVNLPTTGLWQNLSGTTNTLHVEVDQPNGGTDGYSYNNKYSEEFDIPTVITSDFYIWFKTNSAGHENSYTVKDQYGNVVFSKTSMGSNAHYRDTLSLADGCYSFEVFDTDDDGISFWANSDGSGFIQFRSSIDDSYVQGFEPDFGGGIIFSFTVNAPLSYEELNPITETRVFPNPASDRVTLEMEKLKEANVSFYSNTGQLLVLPSTLHDGKITFNTSSLSQGVYYIKIEVGSEVSFEKVVVL